MTYGVLKWEDPPPPHGVVHNWAETARALRTRPGEWARIAEYPKVHTACTFAYRVRSGGLKAFTPAGAYEARPRGGVVWARYVACNCSAGMKYHAINCPVHPGEEQARI